MKKLILMIILLISAIWSNAQTVHHKLYTTYYNQVTLEPDSVSWDLTPSMLLCETHLARLNKFTADPDIAGTSLNRDYAKSGYDQGHQMPAQDNSCDVTGEKECFYFSNMVPQMPSLNRITWKALEVYTRKQAMMQPIHVVCGVSGSLGTIGPDHVNIPAYCWKKLIYRDSVQYYVMPNQDTVKLHTFGYYRVKYFIK